MAEAIKEAMSTPQARDLPGPHVPLRKASAQRRRSTHAPQPLFAPSHHQVRGFNPSPVRALPHIDAVTASSEHAFAGRDVRRPSKLPLGSLVLRQGQEGQSHHPEWPSSSPREDGFARPPSSPLLPPPPMSPNGKSRGLRSTRSIGEGLRGLRQRISSKNSIPKDGRATPDSMAPRPSVSTEEVRQSFRSALTSHSSTLNTSSINTDISSMTAHSSNSDYVAIYPHWPDTERTDGSVTGSMSNESVIGMYAGGFESAKQSMDTQYKRSTQTERPKSMHTESLQPILLPDKPKRANRMHRRSQSAGLLDQWNKPSAEASLTVPSRPQHQRTSTQIITNRDSHQSHEDLPASQSSIPEAVPRDRYGFKKTSHYISVAQYDAWDAQYSEHLARRSRKWQVLMRSYGLATDKSIRFPPKSDKVKRYVRKGIPHELRGPAWFWYAGGPGRLAKEPRLYWELVEQVENGKLSDNDREHIERDLNRTFPDNIRFKPDPTTMSDVQAGAGGGKKRRSIEEPETPMVQSLRRLLQAFAVHNPNIGYCQSLNFIAGLLLLVLDQDEEKAFILLEIVTSIHLPGTHGVALEGANIDIAVLMFCIRDTLPAIWEKLDDKGGGMAHDPSTQALRLPTVSLATTAWFMSLFVGTLPIECVLRVWDCLFFEGSKTLFRIALAIFKAGEKDIMAVSDPMEIFQVVQTIPRSMLDVNALMEVCFRRRGGFGHISQDLIERRREERRREVREGVSKVDAGGVSRWRSRWHSRVKM